MSHHAHSLFLLALFAMASLGCSGAPGRVHQPKYAGDSGTAALAAYDTNRDGALAANELEQAPALREVLAEMDSDADGKLTAAEIDARVQKWRDTRVAEMPVRCEVMLDGKPLEGANVVLEPESFLGPELKPATGTSDSEGMAGISLAAEHLADPRYPGMACGFYKIRITHPSKSIPARYNTTTTLGCEVAVNAAWQTEGAVQLQLKSTP